MQLQREREAWPISAHAYWHIIMQCAPRTLVLFINPRRACAARVTVVGFVILSVKRDLTSRMSNRAISERAYSVACERQKICGEFPETAAF